MAPSPVQTWQRKSEPEDIVIKNGAGIDDPAMVVLMFKFTSSSSTQTSVRLDERLEIALKAVLLI